MGITVDVDGSVDRLTIALVELIGSVSVAIAVGTKPCELKRWVLEPSLASQEQQMALRLMYVAAAEIRDRVSAVSVRSWFTGRNVYLGMAPAIAIRRAPADAETWHRVYAAAAAFAIES